MKKTKKLVLVGMGEFGQIAYEYFTHDSDYEVVAFSAEAEFVDSNEFMGLPVVPLNALTKHYPADEYHVHVAITFTKLNTVRERIFNLVKDMGYTCANYISSKAFVWRNVKLGENIFVFEHNTVQPFCEIEDNVVLWSGNHVGHRTVIRKHCYLSSHVVISGYCDIGENCFIGVNATFADKVKIGRDCFVAMACGITKSQGDNLLLKGMPAAPSRLSAKQYMKVA